MEDLQYSSVMMFKSGSEMLEKIASDVVLGRDEVLFSDDPMTRSIGFVIRRNGSTVVEYLAPLTRVKIGLDDDQCRLLSSQAGRAKMAQIMQAGIPKHGHGFKHSSECQLCLATDVMES